MNPNAAQHQQPANIQEHQQELQQQQLQQLQHQQQEQEQSSEVDENQSTNQTIESWQGESGDIEMVSGQEQGQGQDEKRKAGDVPWEECAKQSDVALQELKRPQAVVVPDVNYQTQQSQKNSGQQLHGVQVIDLQQGDQPWGANFPFIYRQALRMPPPEETPDIAFGIPVDPIFYPHQLTSYIHPDNNNNNNTTTALHEENQKFQWQQNIQGQNTQQNVVSSGNNNNNNNSNTGQEEDAKENFDQNFNSGSDASGM